MEPDDLDTIYSRAETSVKKNEDGTYDMHNWEIALITEAHDFGYDRGYGDAEAKDDEEDYE